MLKNECLRTDEHWTSPFTEEEMYALFKVRLLMETEAWSSTQTQTFWPETNVWSFKEKSRKVENVCNILLLTFLIVGTPLEI